MSHWTKRLFLKTLGSFKSGSLEVVCPDRSYEFGSPGALPRATVAVHDEEFFRRAVLGGDTGMAEAYMDGLWSSPDLTSVIRLGVRNLAALETSNSALSIGQRLLDVVGHKLRPNNLRGSRKNIEAHYDLSNDFFRLFLDEKMLYSSAVYLNAGDTLEQAQIEKIDRLCRKLRLTPGDHVLEIGSGWGAFAEHAVNNYGVKITSTTISKQQYEHCAEVFRNLSGQAELLFEDYRKLTGQYDKIVSIEMFEAVGYEYYDEFFSACDRLLKPGGTMAMQTITIIEQKFEAYRKQVDFIQKYIFPGSELASVAGILQSLGRSTKLSLYHAEDIGTHYARTLAEWRKRFNESLDDARKLGFDDRFLRMWDYYFAYCEGAFLERHIGDMQLVLAKNGTQQALYGEPWESNSIAHHSAARH